MADKGKRMSALRPLRIAAAQILACILVVVARVVYLYGLNFWQSTTAINFLAAWIPAAIGIVVAFVPDKDLERHMRLRWRFTVASFFVGWSVVLWHQQVLNDQASTGTNSALLTGAISKANQHSDEKFAGVQKDVGDLGDKVETVNKQQIELAQDFAKATGDIKTNLGKVGKPDPPEPAKLRVSLWKDGQGKAQEPVESETVQQNPDGTVTAQFLVRNISNTGAQESDLWVMLCDSCTFAKEPDGFEKPAGTPEKERHIHMSPLNPGVAFKVLSVTFKSEPTFPKYAMGFLLSCGNCGKMDPMKNLYFDVEQ
jgi:hypothetical protein